VIPLSEAPEGGEPVDPDGYSTTVLQEDGRFVAPAKPVRSLLIIRVDGNVHRLARGYEAIEGYDPKLNVFKTRNGTLAPQGYSVIAEVHPELGVESEPMVFRLERGGKVTIKTVDPDGQPIVGTGARAVLHPYTFRLPPPTTPELVEEGLDPSFPRRVIISHEGRKLVGAVLLNGDEQGAIEVKLQPWGTITGRVVDDQGNPRARVRIRSSTARADLPGESDELPLDPSSDVLDLADDGRFRFEGLVPGLKYRARATVGTTFDAELFRDRVVGPGEVVDLGDVKVVPRNSEPQGTRP
jgi:hypothetical protein